MRDWIGIARANGLDLSARDLDRLAQASPLYAQLVRRDPSVCGWLEEDRNLRTVYRHRALVDEWRAFAAQAGPELANEDLYVGRLRQWRRRMSLRIAYRSVNGFADEPTTVAELSQLADFCVKDCARIALRRWTERLGQPWDERQGRPARCCALALGKLGGEELNFSSDIDLIYIYEGEGHCRRDGAAGPVVNGEFFTKFAETLTRLLTESTSDGFLFRVDVRLRLPNRDARLQPDQDVIVFVPPIVRGIRSQRQRKGEQQIR